MSLQLLSARGPKFEQWLKLALENRAIGGDGVQGTVAAILEAVRERGDRALLELTARYDQLSLTRKQLRVDAEELKDALASLDSAERRALTLAARRITDFHRRTLQHSFSFRDRYGMKLGQIVHPLERVGIYVPGGAGAYPSTVLMNAIPAQVAGVKEIVMTCPLVRGPHSRVVLAAAALAGVKEVYCVGGAQAIAALAYGTESIRPVDKVVGPGNAYVQAAKRMVYGIIDIDKLAGPSEVLVMADESANPDWIAADLIAQAEHGSGDELAVVVTTSRWMAERVAEALDRALLDLPRVQTVEAALAKRGAIVLASRQAEACAVANRIAPEHLELAVKNPASWLKLLTRAGAIFVGGITPAPLGDYLAGPNHVLPTGGAARFASPLGAYDFMRRTSIIQATPAAVRELGPVVAQLARMEGFEGHARAMEQRLEPLKRRSAGNARKS